MTSNTPPDQPKRRIQIVPLPAAAAPSAARFRGRGAWRAPAVVTSTHEPVPFAPRPDPTERLWVVSPARESSTDPESAATSTQGRLHAMLLRERTALLSQIDGGSTTARPAPMEPAAPFPLPTMPVAGRRPRRTPKPLRADASARPLAADIAAAIARATGHAQPPPPAPSLALVRRTTARQRLEIVPLAELPATFAGTPADASTKIAREPHAPVLDLTESPAARTAEPRPAPAAPPEPKHRIIDLRERRRLRGHSAAVYMCPQCDRQGIIDLIDNVAGQVSATCPRCLEMWTTDLHPDHAPIDPN